MKKNFRKVLSVVMILTMVFAMTATAFADTTGTATINYYIYDETEGVSWNVDTVTVNAGQSLYDALNSAQSHYEPNWQESTDVFNGETVYYLTSFMGYQSNVNVDHQYNADGSGWSKDWGWLFTVGDDHVMPTFEGEPNHGMAMNQYTIKTGDSIDIVYTLTETEWDADYNTTYNYTKWY